MPAEPAQWTWPDAWIFAAILATAGEAGAELTSVVAAADWLDHSIPVQGEVEPAVRKLLGAGLITTAGRRFYLTDAGRAIGPPRQRPVGEIDGLLRALDAVPVSEQEWDLLPGELRAAIDAWQQRADEMLAKRSGRRTNRGET